MAPRHALLLSLLLAGCKKSETAFVEAHLHVPSSLPFDLVCGGRVVGRFAERQERVRFELPRQRIERHDIPLAARFETPCGPFDVPVEMLGRPSEDGDAFQVSVRSPADPPLLRVAYDNRGGSATSLKVGQQAFSIAADTKGVLTLAAPTCDDGRAVMAGGAPLGAFPYLASVRTGCGESSQQLVVSLNGQRCYRLRAVHYSVPLFGVPEDAPPPFEQIYRGKALYSVPELAYFLEPPGATHKQSSFSACVHQLGDCD